MLGDWNRPIAASRCYVSMLESRHWQAVATSLIVLLLSELGYPGTGQESTSTRGVCT